ncbi:hypothetical protein FS837_009135 [Tulasnella sp. UAMH 9824]|nr:hypothetical protein FS837_009135 [Tulasnella sp. UAMH 9824]
MPCRSDTIPPRTPLLPLEILVEIFLLSQPPIHRSQAPHKTALALVCRFWNNVIESTPILWSKISIADELTYVRKSLINSGKFAIDVYGANPDPIHSLSPDHWFNFLREVRRHAERWRHVVLRVMGEEEHGPSVTALPFLESLELRSNHDPSVRNQYPAWLNSAHRPRLRTLLLHSLKIFRWEDVSFSLGLSKLDIQNFNQSGPSSSELLSILTTCPNLAILRLHYVDSRPEDDEVDDHINTTPIVELPSLQRLTLEDVSDQLARDLLAGLRVPEDCFILLRCTIPNSDPTTSFLNPALLRYRRTFQLPGETPRITILVVRTGFRLIVTGGRWCINLNLGRTRAIREAIGWFGIATDNNAESHLGHLPTDCAAFNDIPVTLKIAFSTRTNIEFDYLDPVIDLPCITKIEMTRLWPRTQTKLLYYLSDSILQVTPPANSALWGADGAQPRMVHIRPFPGLRGLVLKGLEEDALRAAIEFIKSRVPGGRAPLEQIEFLGRYDEAVRQGAHPLAVDPKETRWSLYLELFDVLTDDTKVFWGGKRIFKKELWTNHGSR